MPDAPHDGSAPEPAAELGANPAPVAPEAPTPQPAQLVEHFFRHEKGRLHGALVRLLGVHHLSLAEDLAQEAMLRALRTWSMGGVPANPSAWITQVAMNLARDALRHRKMATGKEAAIITHHEQTTATPAVAWEAAHGIRDDALRLMFVCAHPAIAPDAQVILALKILCGFSTGEIARAFLATEAAIEKQLTRTKQRIAEAGIGFELPEGADLAPRLDGVLAAIYQLFNEGYKASSGDRLLREELCQEAVRLGLQLVAHPAGRAPRCHALLALMLLTIARFPSRLDEQGAVLRLDAQDRSKWNQALIARGLVHLAAAAEGDALSEYHLQAGIAATHCLAPDYLSTDWDLILRHYDELLRLKPSPVVALNRAVAVANRNGPQAGLDALAAIAQREKLETHYLLHAVEGELRWRLGEPAAAAAGFRRALALAQVGPEKAHLTRMLERCEAAGVM
ncbi:RNA polymerase sigma factor [Lacunisphaera limnophila]|uniref:RNA polymerase sigma factor n=1 Tax=Lacunisphaera limnophila TaxID=1838286 RepID=UPI0008597E7B|nr:sigma-70 family RNA polymerase sigma factor [Lacunisphaera limnophila]